MNTLITGDLADVVALSCSQAPGDLTPTFQAKLYPNEAEFSDSAWLTYTPPDKTFTIGGVTWACTPVTSRVSLSPDTGVTVEVQYQPTVFYTLHTTGYDKHLVFLSCPKWQYAILEDEYDPDEYDVYYTPCDPYIQQGWTVNAVLKRLSTLSGVRITSLLPTFHVPQATLLFEKGRTYADMIASLLPSGWTYAWDCQLGRLRLMLVEPTVTGFTLTAGMLSANCDTTHRPTYTLVEATAGDSDPTATVSLGRQSMSWSYSSRRQTTVTETLPDEIRDVNGVEEIHRTTRTFITDTTNQVFAVTASQTDVFIGDTLIRQIAETFSYDNQDAVRYETPRMTAHTSQTTGITSSIGMTAGSSSYGASYVITADYTVMLSGDYADLPEEDQPEVLACVYGVWGEPYETVTETKTYITTDTASRDWPEGTEQANTVIVTKSQAQVQTTWVDLSEDRQALAQRVAGILSVAGADPDTVSLSWAHQTWVRTDRRIHRLSDESYEFEETHTAYNAEVGGIVSHTQRTAIDGGRIPSLPTRYRLRQLRATLGETTSPPVTPLAVHANTTNPTDAETWWALKYWQATHPQRTLTVNTADLFVPAGGRLGGGTVIGWDVSLAETSQEQYCTLTLI